MFRKPKFLFYFRIIFVKLMTKQTYKAYTIKKMQVKGNKTEYKVEFNQF